MWKNLKGTGKEDISGGGPTSELWLFEGANRALTRVSVTSIVDVVLQFSVYTVRG